MTVGIAALCEFSHGAKVVCATDGRLSLPQGVSADVNAPKMIFLGDWVFMFAGELSEADLYTRSHSQRQILSYRY